MNKSLSFEDHIKITYFLKVAHLETLRASVILQNKDGKSKPAARALNKLNTDLFEIRSQLDDKLFKDFLNSVGEPQLMQRYFGPIDRKLKLMLNGKNIFFDH